MITYWLEGVLACIYSFFVYVDPHVQAGRFQEKVVSPKWLPSLSSAIVATTPELLSSMLLF